MKYNEDFRSYYLVKFNSNPKFVLFTERLTGCILPNVKTYCEFIPNVYYISAKNIEGSLVPYIIAKNDTTRKNLIITGEFYDTQYSFINNFVNHFIYRHYNNNVVYSDILGYISSVNKKPKSDIADWNDVFSNYSRYCSLMSVLGNKIRSIDSISGFGPVTLQKCIENGLAQQVIQSETTSPEIIGDIFKDGETKEEFVNNFYCSSIEHMYNELTEAEKSSILNQKIDRIDNSTLQSINSTKFYNHPLILEGLLI